jgi:hypothetical protein
VPDLISIFRRSSTSLRTATLAVVCASPVLPVWVNKRSLRSHLSLANFAAPSRLRFVSEHCAIPPSLCLRTPSTFVLDTHRFCIVLTYAPFLEFAPSHAKGPSTPGPSEIPKFLTSLIRETPCTRIYFFLLALSPCMVVGLASCAFYSQFVY